MDQKGCCSHEEEESEIKRYCVDCRTTKTPRWRGGPNGPKTLCNACGIRYGKRRAMGMKKGGIKYRKRRAMGMKKGEERERKREREENGDLKECLKMKIMAMGEEVTLHSNSKQKRKKLGEEEQAAACLIALSCGFVFA